MVVVLHLGDKKDRGRKIGGGISLLEVAEMGCVRLTV
jgi:hypothetical protein